MYIKKTTATTVELLFNTPEHGINWATAMPGAQITLLDQASFAAVAAWKDAGAYVGGAVPQLTLDADNRAPGDPGYVETYTPAIAAAWTITDNRVCALPDGAVELRLPDGTLHDTVQGQVVQAEAA